MRSQPLVFPTLPLPPAPSSTSSSSSCNPYSSRPAMGLFHPSPPIAHRPPPPPPTMAPPPSRAAAILASQAIKKEATGSASASASSTGAGAGAGATLASTSGSSRRTSAAAKDNKRRATHSQIERRRREKINDRLITLRNLVPACNEEIAARQRLEGGGGEAGQPANAASPTTEAGADEALSGPGAKRKRKRSRRKVVEEAKDKDKDAEPELGMHKLDVLTHTIDFIYQLQARIQELETGKRPGKAQRIDRGETIHDDIVQDTTTTPPPTGFLSHSSPPSLAPPSSTATQVPIDEKHPRGFTPVKLGGNYPRDLGHVRSMSASSETASEADLPLPHQLAGSVPGYGYGYNHGYWYDSSPNFPAAASSSSAPSSSSKGTSTPASSGGLSSLTSPFMSLSASSPIFLAGNGSGSGSGRKKSFDARVAAPSFALPPAAIPLYEAAHPHQHHHGEVRGQHGSTSSVRDGVTQEEELAMKGEEDEEEDHEMVPGDEYPSWPNSSSRPPTGKSPEPEASSAARLLLAISASPEDALRPIGSRVDPRTNGTTAPPRLTRRSTTTSFHVDRPEMMIGRGLSNVFIAHSHSQTQSQSSATYPSTAAHTQYRRWIPGSAPGGSRATTGGGAAGRIGSLPSPPLLALDDQTVRE
ncbi:hypothetical protein BCV69DRAFT_301756 [Microstroma glucosiphilum]|uniref:BHLH domain-containing protein n=1 Tax=Pseudomicrostroma glucosiphilum TaxID=1684307 RepID=A0A316TXQ9_9BASI|nr:hypothetical protein BCV69DRAFT_301756 [Pseudomicrostroma glucosiphilum]PWN18017.1 hypothetical protein BCV69DRAFT_301756 [Pseudomicrostroma glucosiphilum]